METKTQNDFAEGSIPRHILHMAGPITVAELVNILYNIVDRMYIGHLPGAGAVALAGLGICLPFTMVVAAFSRLCGEGGAPLSSIERGRGNNDLAEQIQGNSFTMLLIIGALITLIGNLFLCPILTFLGADAETMPYALSYGRIYISGSPFVMLSLGMNPYITAQGFAKTGMLTVTIGAVINILLDPLFIFVFDMGVAGAALASVLAQAVSAAWVLRFLTGKAAILRLTRARLRLDGGLVKRILSLGASGFVVGLTNSTVQSVANRVLGAFGGSVYISLQTVIASVREIISMPITGATSGAKTVIGFNYGAKQYDRVRESIRFTTLATLGYNTCAWLLVLLLPRQLMGIFTSDTDLISAGVTPFRIYYACFVFMTFQMVGQASFSGMGFARQSVFFSLFRKIILVVPMMLLLPHIGGLGVMGVFLAEPISDVIGGLASYLTMYFTVYKRLGSAKLRSVAGGED